MNSQTQSRIEELRTPIALPVTSLEGAKVIYAAGTTSKGKELVLSVVRKTPSDTHAREQSETLMSGREVSAHTNTNIVLLAQIQQLQHELTQTKAENIVFKAQVEERSSSSTSVKTQLTQLKDEIENIRISLIPKLNSIETSQMNSADDIANMTDSHSQLANYSLQLDFIQGQVFSLQTQVQHSDAYMKTHFQQVESALDHLNTGMGLLYSMVKKVNTTTHVERTFFEGGSGGSGGSAGGVAQVLVLAQEMVKGQAKEVPQSGKAKSVEDSSTKG